MIEALTLLAREQVRARELELVLAWGLLWDVALAQVDFFQYTLLIPEFASIRICRLIEARTERFYNKNVAQDNQSAYLFDHMPLRVHS